MSALPSSMKVIAIRAPGAPEMLVPEQRPLTMPGPGEILVKVAAAGVNRPDVRQRQGTYPPPKGATDIPGLEIAGEVVALGQGAQRYKLGDKVCALVVGGGYAEYCPAHESHALPVPPALSMVEAAAMPETFFTCWQNMFMRAQVRPGDWVLVHGGTSGIGTTAIMLAKAFDAKVITTAGSAEKCAAAKKLGAEVAVNYKTEDFVEATKQATGGAGANLIVDIVGGEYVDRNYDAAAEQGVIAQVSFTSGPKATVNFARLMAKRLTHTGSTLRPRTLAEKAAIAEGVEENVWPLVTAGRIKPVIDFDIPARSGLRRPRANGIEPAHWQDRADGVITEVAGEYCSALRDSGVRCTLKHFPGLGRVFEDTHLDQASLDAPVATLANTDWVPFQTLMHRARAFTMLGHVRLSEIDRERPASFSAPVVSGLLRDDWKHDGVLVTDDFSMAGVYGSDSGLAEASVSALNAGVDLILISYDPDLFYPAMHALLRADQAGLLRKDMLDRSDRRLA